jgi:hypothetical protein
MENTMKMRIAIFATCALAQTAVARADFGTAFESKNPVRIADVGPKTMIVAGGFKIGENESPRPQNRLKASRKGNAVIGIEKTFLDGFQRTKPATSGTGGSLK